MDQRTENKILTNPTTGKELAKEVDDKGVVIEKWTVANACLSAIELAPAQNTAQVAKNLDLYREVKAQLEKPELILSKSDFTELEKIVGSFQPFLAKGVLFSDLYTALESRQEVA